MSVLSYPKDKIRFLLLENVHPQATALLRQHGYTQIETLAKALSADELIARLPEVHVLGLRSKTKLPPQVVAHAHKLLAVGAFCIGTDQMHLPTLMQQGVAAFNSPYSSTRSVAELTVGACIQLMRRLPEKSAAAHRGLWLKTSEGCHEVRGKVLGIVGYGRIGSQVSVLAEALGMQVAYYDIIPTLVMGNARRMDSLEALLATADILTLHVPDTPQTRKLLNARTLHLLKPGAHVINYSRGQVVDTAALADAIRSGHVAGAAVDVFEQEPAGADDPFVSPLQGLPNVILSPHIGGSTEEAQENIGLDVAQKLVDFLDTGSTLGSVTLPELQLPRMADTHRLLHIHHNRAGVLSELNSRLSAQGFNIVGQYLKTNEHIGYVVLDIARGNTPLALEILRDVKDTIRVRSLY
jgi:D-3-phosphoglycerate dehydrogenase